MPKKTLKPFRIFVDRHYIAVEWFDVMAESSKKAAQLAEKYARKLKPDARASATDNGWHADEPTELEAIGQGKGSYDMREVEEDSGVFQDHT